MLLDACVLYPIGLRDTVLNMAEAGCFRVLWTEEILAETSRNIVEDTPGLTAEHLEKTFAAMRRAFPEAMVEDYEHLVASMTNHPKDRHVLAAAVAADADVIVTLNIRHFPRTACDPSLHLSPDPGRPAVRGGRSPAPAGARRPDRSSRPQDPPTHVAARDARPPRAPRPPLRRSHPRSGAREASRRTKHLSRIAEYRAF